MLRNMRSLFFSPSPVQVPLKVEIGNGNEEIRKGNIEAKK